MPDDRAGGKLTQALASRGFADVRDAYRKRMRHLRATDPEAYRRATTCYETEIVARLEHEDEALDAWIEYGRVLGELSGPGRLLAIDPSGRAQTYRAPLAPDTLVLFIPEDRNDDVLTAMVPLAPSRAQHATHALLVDKKLSLDA